MRVVILIALAIFPAQQMLACSCITTGDAFEAVARQPVVFRGTVVASEMLFIEESGSVFATDQSIERKGTLARVAVLQVIERFKGELAPFVIIATGSGAGDCGYSFEAGKTYIVFGSWSDEPRLSKLAGTSRALTTSTCSFTAEETAAADLLLKIRKAYHPTAPVFIK